MTWSLLLALLVLPACGHSPPPTLYTLTTRPGAPRDEVAGVVEVRTPALAGYLDRHQLVRAVGAARLELVRDAEWAEPLAGMIGRVLASDLAGRLPNAVVTTDSGHARAEAEVRVELDVRRFELDASGGLVFDGVIGLRPLGRPPVLHGIVLTEGAGQAPEQIIGGMSELLSQLAARIASLLPALTRPASSAPPAAGRLAPDDS